MGRAGGGAADNGAVPVPAEGQFPHRTGSVLWGWVIIFASLIDSVAPQLAPRFDSRLRGCLRGLFEIIALVRSAELARGPWVWDKVLRDM